MTRQLGHNEDRRVFCDLCQWSRECDNMEQIEFFLAVHLRDEHGLPLLYRIQDDNLKRTEIPPLSAGGAA